MRGVTGIAPSSSDLTMPTEDAKSGPSSDEVAPLQKLVVVFGCLPGNGGPRRFSDLRRNARVQSPSRLGGSLRCCADHEGPRENKAKPRRRLSCLRLHCHRPGSGFCEFQTRRPKQPRATFYFLADNFDRADVEEGDTIFLAVSSSDRETTLELRQLHIASFRGNGRLRSLRPEVDIEPDLSTRGKAPPA